MRVSLVTNLNGKGLQVDAELLCQWLVERDHDVTVIQYDAPMPTEEYDLAICLEVVALPNAKQLYYLANPEWLLPSYIRTIQRSFQKVLAKTRDAERVLRERFSNVEYVGFLCRDKRDLSVRRERKFLHLGGGSGFRNTTAVIEAWREYRYWDGLDECAPLTVISNSTTVEHQATPGITFIKRASDEEIKQLQNSHLFHLFPSSYEGYGHAIHEAQSVGAILLTTGDGPMAELKAPFEVLPVNKKKNNMGMLCEVSPQSIRETVPRMLAQPNHVIAKMQVEARARWELGNAEFTESMEGLLKPRVSSPQLRLARLGNFDPPHSTENGLLWTLRDLGHSVMPFQENRDTTDDILAECSKCGVKLLIYVHTHSWITPGKITLGELIEELRKAGIKTASFHLDRYVNLNIGDHRHELIGRHPFWRCDQVFTADGGHQDIFAALGIAHTWLPPGVRKDACYSGTLREELQVEIGFVGAVEYHKEYPFRSQMVEYLKAYYGDRFRVFSGYRGSLLNDLYASISICVGDCCFAGEPKYWSDRLSECTGRGGFLLHPQVEGMCIPTATYTPQDINDLCTKIDHYLESTEERELIRRAAQLHTKQHDTYHERMTTLLHSMGI